MFLSISCGLLDENLMKHGHVWLGFLELSVVQYCQVVKCLQLLVRLVSLRSVWQSGELCAGGRGCYVGEAIDFK